MCERCSQTSVELDFGLGRLTSHLHGAGRGVFGAIPESGSASESQSQTRGTSIVRRVVGYVSGWQEQLL